MAILALFACSDDGLAFLWVGVAGYLLVIITDWPVSAERRAEIRAEVDFKNAEAEARGKADALLIEQLARELRLTEEQVAPLYRDAPGIVARRNKLRERYQRGGGWRHRGSMRPRRSFTFFD